MLFLWHLLLILVDIKVINGLKRSEVLDPEGRFQVSWKVDKTSQLITFEVLARTTGYVGFGISPSGGMAGSDIIIGGVAENGSFYFQDRYADRNGMPIIDHSQDWTLLNAWENSTFTYLKFSRLIITCDEMDVKIAEDALRFIWALGQDDNINYHKELRGSYFVNILDPPVPEINLDEYESFEAINDVTMLPKPSTYVCSVHRSPLFLSKIHTIAFRPKMFSEKAKKHTHHLSFYKCQAPHGLDPEEFFEGFVIPGGQDCFDGTSERALEIYRYCRNIFYSWALGARVMQMPPRIGYPISDGGREYFMMEMHINNPDSEDGIWFQSGVEIFLSPELKPIESGVLNIGIESNWKLMIPPNSADFKVSAHCTSTCTSFMESEGYTFFNVELHAHSSARKMRLRHFRNGSELEWIADDQTYDNNFQGYRNINPVKILPGDHLTLECWYDNTWIQPPATVLGGYSTREEMCDAMIYYYPKGRILTCGSESIGYRLLRLLGVGQLSRRLQDKANPRIISPAQLDGQTLKDYLDRGINWTSSLRQSVQNRLTIGPHESHCVLNITEENRSYDYVFQDITTYPVVHKLYERVDECLNLINDK